MTEREKKIKCSSLTLCFHIISCFKYHWDATQSAKKGKDNCYGFARQAFGSGGAIWVASVRSCEQWEGLTLEKFVENCLPGERSHTRAGEECKESSSCQGRSCRDNV